MGITRHFNPQQVRIAYDKARASKKAGLKQLEKMLHKQPWHVTTSFKEAVSENLPLNLTGLADPTGGREEMFDLTKVRRERERKRERGLTSCRYR